MPPFHQLSIWLRSKIFEPGSAFHEARAISMDENKPDLKVDQTPISPVQRRDSLEKHLQTRPDAQDLKNRHILLDTNAAP